MNAPRYLHRPRRWPVSSGRRLVTLLGGCLLSLHTLAAPAQSVQAAQPASATPWAADVNKYATKTLENAQALGLAAVPLNGPGTAQFIHADTPMTPGSIMKLITTYAALELLGPNYTWDTAFLTDGKLEGDTLKGNLYVRFSGDPKLTIERLWTTLGELHGLGIHDIEGDLVLDGSYFRLEAPQPAFDDNGDEPYAPFLVPPSAYLSNLNLQHVQLSADERGARAWSTPELPGVSIEAAVQVAPPGECPDSDSYQWQPTFQQDGGVSLRITGKLPLNCRSEKYLSLLPPDQYSEALIRQLLAGYGIAVSGTNRLAETPEDARELAITTSPDLATMVRDINKWSSNVMARQMLLNIGAATRAEEDRDDRVAGIAAIHHWLEQKGIDTTGMVIDNGAGLAREARISARQGVQLLQDAWNSPYAADLMASMPIIAMDGTMARRLRDTALRGQGRIKTGSLDNVRSIAGFTRDEKNTTWAVVAIVNNTPAWNGQAVLDHVLYSLYFHPPEAPSLTQAAEKPD